MSKLNQDIIAVMNDPDTNRRFAEQGAERLTSTPEEFHKLIESDIAKWRKVITDAKITVD